MMLHRDMDLKTALQNIRTDGIFWGREFERKVDEYHDQRKSKGGGGGKGSGWAPQGGRGKQAKPWSPNRRQSPWGQWQPGNVAPVIQPWLKNPKGGKGGKGKAAKDGGKKGAKGGKKGGKNGMSMPWCKHDGAWTEYCTQFQMGKCKFGGQCRKSHNCPVDMGGWACDATHMAKNHR